MNKQPNSLHCFICGLENIAGVQVAFYETTSDDNIPEVLARFTAREIHQGYPGRMHGGVATGILDETIGRAVNIGVGDDAPQFWGVTADIALRFHHPIPLNIELTARGRITRNRRKLFEGSGEIYLPNGTIAVSATGKYFKLTLNDIADADTTDLGWRVYPD